MTFGAVTRRSYRASQLPPESLGVAPSRAPVGSIPRPPRRWPGHPAGGAVRPTSAATPRCTTVFRALRASQRVVGHPEPLRNLPGTAGTLRDFTKQDGRMQWRAPSGSPPNAARRSRAPVPLSPRLTSNTPRNSDPTGSTSPAHASRRDRARTLDKLRVQGIAIGASDGAEGIRGSFSLPERSRRSPSDPHAVHLPHELPRSRALRRSSSGKGGHDG